MSSESEVSRKVKFKGVSEPGEIVDETHVFWAQLESRTEVQHVMRANRTVAMCTIQCTIGLGTGDLLGKDVDKPL